jgi:DNA-binding protein H-NS
MIVPNQNSDKKETQGHRCCLPWAGGRLGTAEGIFMKGKVLQSMSIDEMWSLHERVTSILARKIAEEKAGLEERLRKVQAASNVITSDRRRRPYPKVLPKYRNPKNHAEIWSGRGRQPRWLTAQLRTGKKVNDFLI